MKSFTKSLCAEEAACISALLFHKQSHPDEFDFIYPPGTYINSENELVSPKQGVTLEEYRSLFKHAGDYDTIFAKLKYAFMAMAQANIVHTDLLYSGVKMPRNNDVDDLEKWLATATIHPENILVTFSKSTGRVFDLYLIDFVDANVSLKASDTDCEYEEAFHYIASNIAKYIDNFQYQFCGAIAIAQLTPRMIEKTMSRKISISSRVPKVLF